MVAVNQVVDFAVTRALNDACEPLCRFIQAESELTGLYSACATARQLFEHAWNRSIQNTIPGDPVQIKPTLRIRGVSPSPQISTCDWIDAIRTQRIEVSKAEVIEWIENGQLPDMLSAIPELNWPEFDRQFSTVVNKAAESFKKNEAHLTPSKDTFASVRVLLSKIAAEGAGDVSDAEIVAACLRANARGRFPADELIKLAK